MGAGWVGGGAEDGASVQGDCFAGLTMTGVVGVGGYRVLTGMTARGVGVTQVLVAAMAGIG